MTITAVAQRAKVSTATVSRVLNGTAKVREKTATKVREAIAELDFYPDINARALGSGRSGLYGLIISDITNPYFPELVKAFEDIALEHGQEVMIGNTDYNRQRMEQCVARMLQRKVDGVAVMTSELDDDLVRNFSHRKIPTIFMDPPHVMEGVSSVRVDYARGIALAVAHLVELGHVRIGFITGPLKLASAQLRFKSFQKSMKRHGLEAMPSLIVEGDHRAEGGRAAMKAVLDSGEQPTAVIGSNDLTAIGAMGAIHDAGLRVPQDISVIGFDDIKLASFTYPGLTTLHIPRGEMAALAFRGIYQKRDALPSAAEAKEHVLKPKLVVRGSTGKPGIQEASPS